MLEQVGDMMRKRTAMIIAGAVFVMMALTGCMSKQPQTATLSLDANPTTGYEWRVEQEPEIFDISSEYVQDKADEELDGVGGNEVFTLTPKKEGKAKVSFYYERSWEKDKADTSLTYQISVDGNKQIKVEAQSGGLPGDISTVPEIPEMEIQ